MAETQEATALELLRIIAIGEGKRLTATGEGELADRDWVLDTYAECLRAVMNHRTPTHL